ncbi:MAG: DoxX family protein [Muribaculaceae bacterium]
MEILQKLNKFNKKRCRWIVAILRLFIGSVFIFSGFVKGIDPWGSIYKFAEYISSFGFSNFEPFLLFMAMSVAIFEFIFGVFVLLGCYRKIAPMLLLIVMFVMLPLTFYISITDNVNDCGCFGDAIVISNWATFIKNIFITLALVYLCFYNKRLKNIYGVSVQWLVCLFTFSYIMVICFIGYFYQPLIDFRPYKVGTKIASTLEEEINSDNYLFVYEKDGIKKDFSMDSLPDETWNFVERKEIKSHSLPKIEGISIFENDEDITSKVLSSEGEQIILLFPNLKEVDISSTYMINEICDFAKTYGINVIGLTSASKNAIAEWNDLSMASYKLYVIDDSELKAIARGNPAIVYVKDGIIEWKQSLQSISSERLLSEANTFSQIIEKADNGKVLTYINIAYIISLTILLLINRTHKVIKFKAPTGKKNQNKDVNLQQN